MNPLYTQNGGETVYFTLSLWQPYDVFLAKATLSVSLPPPPPPPATQVIGETGRVTDLTDQPQVITLTQSFANPVIFAQSVGGNEADPVIVRVSNIQSNQFTLSLAEPSNLDGVHGAERVAWVVLEAGTHTLANGALLEVGRVTTGATVGNLLTNQWHSVGLATPFSAKPVLLSQIQTHAGSDYLQTRHSNRSSGGFDVALEQAESITMQHAAETIGFLAIEAGTGTWSGLLFEAFTTTDVVDQNWFNLAFTSSFASKPNFLTSMVAYEDADNAHLRYSSLSATGVLLKSEEDTTQDVEVVHGAERAAYLAIEGSGLLEALPPPPAVIGEVGRVTDLTDQPQVITLSQSFTNPVVFAQSAGGNEADPAVVRITNIQSNQFTMQLAEPWNLDGTHGDERVAWIVLEAGTHTLEGGELLEVGTVTTGATVGTLLANQWRSVSFATPFATFMGMGGYSAHYDLNGDGFITSKDVLCARSRDGNALPSSGSGSGSESGSSPPVSSTAHASAGEPVASTIGAETSRADVTIIAALSSARSLPGIQTRHSVARSSLATVFDFRNLDRYRDDRDASPVETMSVL